MKGSPNRWLVSVIALLALTGACRDGSAQPRPVPTPVVVATESPERTTRQDPTFEEEFGPERSTAYYGDLGPALYRIEIPKDWNGRLVMYLHGYAGATDRKLRVEKPENRRALVRAGYAWAASSYSSQDFSDEMAADETAALWDEFVRRFGRPKYTYLEGKSRGGAAALISAERYADRYDGALTLCSTGDLASRRENETGYLVAALFAAGIRQTEFDQLLQGEQDEFARTVIDRLSVGGNTRYAELWIAMSGGERPLARDTFSEWGQLYIESGAYQAKRGYLGNRGVKYAPGLDTISDDEFNAAALRFSETQANPDEAVALNGNIHVPIMALHTTGDGLVPLVEQQDVRRLVDAAGQGHRLVQRTIESATHCGFSPAEYDAAMSDLVRWVEKGKVPAGEDLLANDLTTIGTRFASAPHLGSAAATELVESSGALRIAGTLSLDGGVPFTPFLGVFIKDAGLFADCRLEYDMGLQGGLRAGGAVEPLRLASDSIIAGCGRPGSRVFYSVLVGETFDSTNGLTWPEHSEATASLDGQFDARNPAAQGAYTWLIGDVLRADGTRMPPGTLVEAFIGEALCGHTSVPRIARQLGDMNLMISGPEDRPGCERASRITFRVNGEPARADKPVTNTLDRSNHSADVILDDG